MPFAVVTVETEAREQFELALPLDVPSRQVAAKIMRDLGKLMRTGENMALFFKTASGDKLIPPGTTLGELGVQDGQHLRIKRQKQGAPATSSRAHAYLKAHTGELLALEANHIIIGRKDPKHQVPLDLDLTRLDPGKAVSRQHAAIGRDGSRYYLLDLESTNGTRVNGEKAVPGKKLPLKDGDTIILGLEVRLTLVVAEAAAPLAAARKDNPSSR